MQFFSVENKQIFNDIKNKVLDINIHSCSSINISVKSKSSSFRNVLPSASTPYT